MRKALELFALAITYCIPFCLPIAPMNSFIRACDARDSAQVRLELQRDQDWGISFPVAPFLMLQVPSTKFSSTFIDSAVFTHRGVGTHPLLLLYNRQQKADGVKQDWTNHPPAHPTGRLAWELRTPTLLRCERFLRTVPQACPVVLSKACRAVSAVTGTQPRASGGRSPASASGGSHASIHRN